MSASTETDVEDFIPINVPRKSKSKPKLSMSSKIKRAYHNVSTEIITNWANSILKDAYDFAKRTYITNGDKKGENVYGGYMDRVKYGNKGSIERSLYRGLSIGNDFNFDLGCSCVSKIVIIMSHHIFDHSMISRQLLPTERRWMFKHGFPDMVEHKVIHYNDLMKNKEFVKQIAKFVKKMKKTPVFKSTFGDASEYNKYKQYGPQNMNNLIIEHIVNSICSQSGDSIDISHWSCAQKLKKCNSDSINNTLMKSPCFKRRTENYMIGNVIDITI